MGKRRKEKYGKILWLQKNQNREKKQNRKREKWFQNPERMEKRHRKKGMKKQRKKTMGYVKQKKHKELIVRNINKKREKNGKMQPKIQKKRTDWGRKKENKIYKRPLHTRQLEFWYNKFHRKNEGAKKWSGKEIYKCKCLNRNALMLKGRGKHKRSILKKIPRFFSQKGRKKVDFFKTKWRGCYFNKKKIVWK